MSIVIVLLGWPIVSYVLNTLLLLMLGLILLERRRLRKLAEEMDERRTRQLAQERQRQRVF